MDKLTLLFPGQGSQYAGMGKSLMMEEKLISTRFEEAADLLHVDLKKVCNNENGSELMKTENLQLAIFVLSFSMYECYKERYKIQPSFLAGHSLGEITALAVSGAISFENALHFVNSRGKAMQKCCNITETTMYAVNNVDIEALKLIMEAYHAGDYGIYIANYNSKKQVVLSGEKDALQRMTTQWSLSADIIPLKVNGGFHSPYMKEAIDELRDKLYDIPIILPKIPVLNANRVRFYKEDDNIKELLLEQITQPVYWKDGLEFLESKNTRLWLEVGPKNVLKNTVLNTIFNPSIISFDSDSPEDIKAELELFHLRNRNRPNLVGLCLGAAVSAKNNNWNNDEYENGVIVPYQKLVLLNDKILDEGRAPTKEEKISALALLKLIFSTKLMEREEQNKKLWKMLENGEEQYLYDGIKLQ